MSVRRFICSHLNSNIYFSYEKDLKLIKFESTIYFVIKNKERIFKVKNLIYTLHML